jgi:hypothetical protein
MYMKDVADLTKTAMITYMLCIPRSSLATLSTLRVLRTLIVLKALKLPPPPLMAVRTISMIERETMPPSSQFILSETYFLMPIAVNLIVNSQMKNQVKKAFALSS